jgi:hypothetical protein
MDNRISRKCNLFMGLQPSSYAIKGFRSKASSPDRLFLQAKWSLGNYGTVS